MATHGMSSRKASQVKRGGHLREQIFSNQFSAESMSTINDEVNFSGASSDCNINHPDYLYIIHQLGANTGATSVKGGNTYQFHLGRLDELVDKNSLKIFTLPSQNNPDKLETCFRSDKTQEDQLNALKSVSFWENYLGKGEILAIDAQGYWNFFLMKDVINLILNPNLVEWRFLQTGRIKGDVCFSNGKKRACITFEHRGEKNQFVLGAHGGKTGINVLFPWLKDHLTRKIVVEKMLT
jgi:hypothetical protein